MFSPLFEEHPRACRYCGCTEDRACVDRQTGLACYWVTQDICSQCVEKQLHRRRNVGKWLLIIALACFLAGLVGYAVVWSIANG